MGRALPPWSNTAIRITLVAIGLGVLATAVTPMVFVRTDWRRHEFEPVDQPVEFDHRHHTQDDGIDCRYCHNTVDRSASAGIPSTDKCMGCHSQIWSQSPLLEPVRRSYFSGMPIPWNRVNDMPDFVYFNHAIHVNKGVGCVSCHGRVDRMARVYQVESLTMSWCLGCHRAPEAHLRPLSAITDMRWQPDGDPERLGREIAAALGVQRLTHCSACHR